MPSGLKTARGVLFLSRDLGQRAVMLRAPENGLAIQRKRKPTGRVEAGANAAGFVALARGTRGINSLRKTKNRVAEQCPLTFANS